MSEPSVPTIYRKLRLSALLIAAGLVVEAITLELAHPLAFMGFLGLAGPLIAAGVVTFLWALVSP